MQDDCGQVDQDLISRPNRRPYRYQSPDRPGGSTSKSTDLKSLLRRSERRLFCCSSHAEGPSTNRQCQCAAAVEHGRALVHMPTRSQRTCSLICMAARCRPAGSSAQRQTNKGTSAQATTQQFRRQEVSYFHLFLLQMLQMIDELQRSVNCFVFCGLSYISYSSYFHLLCICASIDK